MLGFLHKAIITAAAALLSAGYAACVCYSVAAPAHSTQDGHALAVAQAEQQEAAHERRGEEGHDRGSPAPIDHSTCGHCGVTVLANPAAADDAKALAGKSAGGVAMAVSPTRFHASSTGPVLSHDWLRWAAPLNHTPVSLKIRLRN